MPDEQKPVNYFSRLISLEARRKNGVGEGSEKGDKDSLDLTNILDDDLGLINSLLLEGERLIVNIEIGGLTFGRLRQRDINILALYFYLSNPLFNRIVNLHLVLPMSSVTLQKPKTDNTLAQDFVHSWFERSLKRCQWKRSLYLTTLHYLLFGEGLLLCEDDFHDQAEQDDVSEDFLMNSVKMMKPEIRVKIDKNVEKYNEEGQNSITEQQLKYVIHNYMPCYNPKYKGLLRMRVLNPFQIDSVEYNDEVQITVYVYPKSPFIKKFLEREGSRIMENGVYTDECIEDLKTVGYTESFIRLNLEKNADSPEFIQVSNDPYDSQDIYVSELRVEDLCNSPTSLVSSILWDLLRYYHAAQALDLRLKMATKKVVLLTTEPTVSTEQLSVLEGNIMSAIENPEGSIVSANYQVSVEDIRLDIRDDLGLEDIRDAARMNMLIGTGTPDSLVTGDETYGSGFLKLEVLNTEFLALREHLRHFFEDKILKPMAIKRGFVSVDLFGNVTPIHPTINFEVGSIIGQEGFKDLLRDMTAQQQFPLSRLLEFYGFDSEEIFQRLKKDKELLQNMGLMPSDQVVEGGFDPNQAGYVDENGQPVQMEQQQVPQEGEQPQQEVQQQPQQQQPAQEQTTQEGAPEGDNPYQLQPRTRQVAHETPRPIRAEVDKDSQTKDKAFIFRNSMSGVKFNKYGKPLPVKAAKLPEGEEKK